jgi:hypothetical protein
VRKKNMAMGPAEPRTKNDHAGEGQQQFILMPDPKPTTIRQRVVVRPLFSSKRRPHF